MIFCFFAYLEQIIVCHCRGVVQFFNAVKQQQDEISKKLSDAGPSERKREQVLKSIDKTAFLDVLMGGSKSILVDDDVKNETHKNEKHEKKKKVFLDKCYYILGNI